MDDSLTIGVRHEPGYVLITVAGEIDIFTVARLREQLFTLAGDGRPVIADLDRVTFLGAAGLGALAGPARRVAASRASLHVVCARPQTRQLLQPTGLDRTPRGSPAPGPKRSRPCHPPQAPADRSPSQPRSEVTTMTMTEPSFPSRSPAAYPS
jgi:anti-anti-sigma factor